MEKKKEWSDQEWLTFLDKEHPRNAEALERLRLILQRALERSFLRSRRMDRETLEDLCQDSLVRILKERDSFSGRARFTTWAVKVAVNLTLSELRRKRWQDVSLDEQLLDAVLFDPQRMSRFYLTPEMNMMRRSTADMLNRMIEEQLSEKQKRALKMVALYGIPLDEAAERLGTNRNALYKLLHDARKKLKTALEETGMSRKEIFSGMMMVFTGMIRDPRGVREVEV
jgi:RNA polymerase sigma-70 factor (ECF subfamily)